MVFHDGIYPGMTLIESDPKAEIAGALNKAGPEVSMGKDCSIPPQYRDLKCLGKLNQINCHLIENQIVL